MNEKMRILKMIENGQITATEAAQLLQAIDSGGAKTSPPPSPPPPSSHAPHAPHVFDSKKYDGNANNSRSQEDLGSKIESFVQDVAPKVEKFVEAFADKINDAAERVSGAFSAETHDAGSQIQRPSPAPERAVSGVALEKQIEMSVDGTHNELNLSCVNGEIRVKGYNGDKITARLFFRAKKTNSQIEMVRLGGKFFLKYEPDEFSMVSIDAYVPERAFAAIKIEGMNGNIDVSSLSANEMRLSNANGNATLSALAANNLVAETSNGIFSVSKITAENAAFENLNGVMQTDELDVAKLNVSNYNGAVSIIVSKFARYDAYDWNVETGNAKLSINLPTAHGVGYHVKAHAAMSEMRIGLTGLQYLINEPSLVEARSTNFDSAAKKIKLNVETSNAPLVIN
ncbi:MAG: DUF4097 family beta strand repeat-containing protein [Defluviitaleaceae bacterium]|nr:DUF4097 family beta strand repeat-containing protein [Defluviitaleaceae bacterium]